MTSNPPTLIDILQRAAEREPAKAYIFLEDGEGNELRMTYRELDTKALAVAAQIREHGKLGDGALLLYNPGLEYIVALFACLYAGVVPIPAYPPRRNRPTPQLRAIIENSKATIVLTQQAIRSWLEKSDEHAEVFENLQLISIDDDVICPSSHWDPPPIDENTLALLQYTSGSSGKPKGVLLTHRNLIYNQAMIKAAFANDEDSIVFGWLPLYHDMGLIGNVLQSLYLGIDCILMSPMTFLKKPARWLRGISRYKASVSGAPCFAYDLCVDKITPEQCEALDLSHWKLAYVGAEPVRAKTLDRFEAKFKPYGFRRESFYPCYGMAEASLIITGGLRTDEPNILSVDRTALKRNRLEPVDGGEASRIDMVGCGRPWLEEKVHIVDPDFLTPCPDGQVGEVWVSGPNVSQGYLGQAKQTEASFGAYLKNSKEGPYLRTGDMGAIVDCELYITGRLKDVIIVRGRNHYPQDLETTVQNSHPLFRMESTAVFSLEIDGLERIVVIQELKFIRAGKYEMGEVVADIRQAVTLIHGAELHAILFVRRGNIPITSSGKVRRSACREMFLKDEFDTIDIKQKKELLA